MNKKEQQAIDFLNDALIVFISDHGDMMGDHYHWRKTYPYEGSTHEIGRASCRERVYVLV